MAIKTVKSASEDLKENKLQNLPGTEFLLSVMDAKSNNFSDRAPSVPCQ